MCLKGCLNKCGCNFDDVCKLATLGFLKIKVFWNKRYEVIISVHDVTITLYHVTQIRSCDQTLVTLTFQRFKLNNLGLSLGMALKFYTSVTKALKLKVRWFRMGTNSYICRSYWGKPGRGLFATLNRVNAVSKTRFSVNELFTF